MKTKKKKVRGNVASQIHTEKAVNSILGINPEEISIDVLLDLIDVKEKISRIKPFMGTIKHKQRERLIKSFFSKNDKLIINKIKSNKYLKSAIKKLSDAYKPNDIKLRFLIKLIEGFIKELVELFFRLEINYLLHLQENYTSKNVYPVDKKMIKGELLDFSLDKKAFIVNEIPLDSLLGRISMITSSFGIMLLMKTTEWREAYFDLNKKLYNIETLFQKAKLNIMKLESENIKSKNPRGGRPKRFLNQTEFHKKIKSIPNWKSLTKTQLALNLGYASCSGLKALLDDNGWHFPS
jgi:hypothetical protein